MAISFQQKKIDKINMATVAYLDDSRPKQGAVRQGHSSHQKEAAFPRWLLHHQST